LIIGKKMTAAIATLVERTSRYLILVHLPAGYKAPQLRDALIEQFGQIPPAMRKTLTWDQGREGDFDYEASSLRNLSTA
jgi:IS30 family transposase